MDAMKKNKLRSEIEDHIAYTEKQEVKAKEHVKARNALLHYASILDKSDSTTFIYNALIALDNNLSGPTSGITIHNT